MKNRAFSIFVSCLFILLLAACPSKKKEETAKPGEAAPPAVKTGELKADLNSPVAATKTFYDSVVAEKYDVAWKSLTKVSQDKIVSMVAEEEKLDPAAVHKLFDNNETPIQLGFWKSFRASSKVTEYVPQAIFKLVNESGNQATVELANKLVVIESKAFKEGGDWKMGYVETFMSEASPKPSPKPQGP